MKLYFFFFFFSSRRRHTRLTCDWSSDVCSSDLALGGDGPEDLFELFRGRLAPALQGPDVAVDAQGGRPAAGEVQVGCSLGAAQLQQLEHGGGRIGRALADRDRRRVGAVARRGGPRGSARSSRHGVQGRLWTRGGSGRPPARLRLG